MNCFKCNKPIDESKDLYVTIDAREIYEVVYALYTDRELRGDRFLLCPRCYDIFKGREANEAQAAKEK